LTGFNLTLTFPWDCPIPASISQNRCTAIQPGTTYVVFPFSLTQLSNLPILLPTKACFYYLVPICSNHIMFVHDLCNSQIEYLRNSIDFNRKDRAKRYHKSSIFNRQYSIWFRLRRLGSELNISERPQIT